MIPSPSRHLALRRLLLYLREEARGDRDSLLPFLLEMALLEVDRVDHHAKKLKGAETNGRGTNHGVEVEDPSADA